MNSSAVVAVIDDDNSFRESLARLVKSEGYQVIQFASANDFLADRAYQQLACAIIDLRMPGLSGIELQRQITQMLPHVAVIFLTGHAVIADSVHAMKAGAVDFLEKPVAEEELFAALTRAIKRTQAAKLERDEFEALQRKYQLLTPREREVFVLVTAGLLNKQIAYKLGATERTIKAHRRQVMEKLDAESLAHLVRIADQLGIEPISKEEREEISGRRFAPTDEAMLSKQPPPRPLLEKSRARAKNPIAP
jgi:FixJ family two-component response regulator